MPKLLYNPPVMVCPGNTRTSWLVVPAVLLFFFLALNSLVGDSPTMDEQNHMARGLAFLRTGDPRLSLEHPPLVNALSALPLLTLPQVRLPYDHPSWQRQPPDVYWYVFADLFLWQYNRDVTRMVFLARIPVVFLTLGLALVGFHFAGQLWGRLPALFALLFLLFDPNILAHGRYATTDVGGAAFLFLAAFLVWRMWRAQRRGRRRWQGWLAAGIGLGLAFGSKLSTIAFAPIFALLAFLPLDGCWPQSLSVYLRDAGRRLGQLAAAGIVALLVVWVIFGFEWRPFLFQREPLAQLNVFAGPMPTFWAGIEQVLEMSGGGRPAFLLGRFSTEGFPAYFPVAFLAKTPLPIFLLLPVAAVLLLKEKSMRPRALFLLLPAAFYFLLSTQSSLNIGYRHLLPMLPFVLVLISGLASWRVGELRETGNGGYASGIRHQASGIRHQVLRSTFYVLRPIPILIIAIASLLFSDLLIHPHYLSYFNAAAGGPENGHNILIDSNIDWGQDLLRLKAWMAANEVAEVKLAWFGTADPAYYGIDDQPLPGFPRNRYYSLWANPPFNPEAPEPGIY
ncbi:MAG TPA: phospholipid carrier-dependent glycosyltransferase, partial [Anaerolineae bacterium]